MVARGRESELERRGSDWTVGVWKREGLGLKGVIREFSNEIGKRRESIIRVRDLI